MSPEHCRMARAGLDISQQKLAEAAGVSLSTIKDFESGKRSPMMNNLVAMHKALESFGVIFVQNGVLLDPQRRHFDAP
ncbi:helix-turn-helix transcriptional regulator [Beijerinckia sp. L45]|uniref:helix-turn-helix domain-containing protein n=1 Tax=Beijerinckia sp. L45 TaxID=1641855 RepID=UPI00131AF912|nr:helix-turn-helix transcriptional regulator [Beijerinckia sp. L45]